MVDFIHHPSSYHRIGEQLLQSVPGFEASAAFQLVAADRELPSIVCGALAQYLLATERQVISNPDKELVLAAIYQAIEDLSTSTEPVVQNVVVVDILESLFDGSDLREAIARKLQPATKALYEEWIASDPNRAI